MLMINWNRDHWLHHVMIIQEDLLCWIYFNGHQFLLRYNPREFYEKNAELKLALDQIQGGFYSPEDPNLFHDIVDVLLNKGDQ